MTLLLLRSCAYDSKAAIDALLLLIYEVIPGLLDLFPIPPFLPRQPNIPYTSFFECATSKLPKHHTTHHIHPLAIHSSRVGERASQSPPLLSKPLPSILVRVRSQDDHCRSALRYNIFQHAHGCSAAKPSYRLFGSFDALVIMSLNSAMTATHGEWVMIRSGVVTFPERSARCDVTKRS